MRGILFIGTIILLIVGCNNQRAFQPQTEQPQFQLLKKEQTGLNFENIIKPALDFNLFRYMYIYNGGGVSAGDFNNDGLADLYFTSNMGENKLFLNKGNIQFEDVTETAGIKGLEGWTSGVTTVDINNDGMLDIYVSQIGNFKKLDYKSSIDDVEGYDSIRQRNQLYICQEIKDGVPIYKDEAADYNLDLIGFSTQAAFFDYDKDGDLDMYQLNHSLHNNGTFGQRHTFEGVKHPFSGDKLLRNDGGKFTEVTEQAGIISTVIGYGLGITTGDINNDGWTDIYIGNDFHEDDYLYINQQDGTFKEVMREQMLHTSRFSMGVDMADFNNDGWNDVISLDMMPYDPYILKSSLGEDDYSQFLFKQKYGYYFQFARNNLQLNNGDGSFQEIGMFADIHATDWSWASLFMDFDNDGYKDLFIANGIPRRMNDIDYVNFVSTNPNAMWEKNHVDTERNFEMEKKMPQIKIPNKFFRNTNNYKFDDIERLILNDEESYSNGAVYVDLDNDGDLDVVTNNIESEPFVYQNLTRENKIENSDALILKLKGNPENINAIGTKVIVEKGDEKLIYENFPTKGFQSSVPDGLHIGIGNSTNIKKITLIWNDNTYQELATNKVKYNEKQIVEWQAGLPAFDFSTLQNKQQPRIDFEDITEKSGLTYKHVENPFVEFNRERLIPHMTSAEGPALAVGDINGDGLEDVFIGSSKREKSALYLQTEIGFFEEQTPTIILQDSIFEDVDATLVDLDGDGDLDLAIASGGNEYRNQSEALKQRIYFNEGNGSFKKYVHPEIFMTASCVLPSDFDGDGDIDLFYGGRATPWQYGVIPQSYLLENQGNGAFKQVQTDELHNVGFVKDGDWADIDGDGDQDLILAMEWDAVTIFNNDKGKFNPDSYREQKISNQKGWWNMVLPQDFDGDGDIDILAGNLGSNAKFKPTKDKPLTLYVNDFDDNKQIEQVLTYHLGDREIPFANYMELTSQLVVLKKKYIKSKDLANASIEEIFGAEKLKNSMKYTVDELQSVYFENTGDGKFKAHPLPDEVQFSTLESAFAYDFDGNGTKEVILGGNFYECNIEMGRYDASYGNILNIGKAGEMTVSGLGSLKIRGQVRNIQPIKIGNTTAFIFARNNDELRVLKVK